MIKKGSSRYVDTQLYKTLEILLFFTTRASRAPVIPDNKAAGRFVTLCLFHTEKTPSFKLYNNTDDKTWKFKCLGCGASGDVFRLLMRTEGIQFWEALVMVKKAFPKYFYEHKINTSKRQLEIPFPVNEEGQFIWVSLDMKQLGFQ